MFLILMALIDLRQLVLLYVGLCNPVSTGWNVQGPNPVRGRNFLHPCRPSPGPTQPPTQWVPSLLPEDKTAGACLDHPHLSSACSLSWPLLG
jgi:hypothetical protein